MIQLDTSGALAHPLADDCRPHATLREGIFVASGGR